MNSHFGLMRAALVLSVVFDSVVARGEDIPRNATKNASGPGWTCDREFARSGAKCV